MDSRVTFSTLYECLLPGPQLNINYSSVQNLKINYNYFALKNVKTVIMNRYFFLNAYEEGKYQLIQIL